jgi:hypothetical protein
MSEPGVEPVVQVAGLSRRYGARSDPAAGRSLAMRWNRHR